MSAKHTPGPWHPGHLCDETHSCNCAYIFGGDYMGALGEVYVDNGISSVEDGANDCPPLAEAKANLRLMAAAPAMLAALVATEAFLSIVEPRSDRAECLEILGAVRAAIAEATRP